MNFEDINQETDKSKLVQLGNVQLKQIEDISEIQKADDAYQYYKNSLKLKGQEGYVRKRHSKGIFGDTYYNQLDQKLNKNNSRKILPDLFTKTDLQNVTKENQQIQNDLIKVIEEKRNAKQLSQQEYLEQLSRHKPISPIEKTIINKEKQQLQRYAQIQIQIYNTQSYNTKEQKKYKLKKQFESQNPANLQIQGNEQLLNNYKGALQYEKNLNQKLLEEKQQIEKYTKQKVFKDQLAQQQTNQEIRSLSIKLKNQLNFYQSQNEENEQIKNYINKIQNIQKYDNEHQNSINKNDTNPHQNNNQQDSKVLQTNNDQLTSTNTLLVDQTIQLQQDIQKLEEEIQSLIVHEQNTENKFQKQIQKNTQQQTLILQLQEQIELCDSIFEMKEGNYQNKYNDDVNRITVQIKQQVDQFINSADLKNLDETPLFDQIVNLEMANQKLQKLSKLISSVTAHCQNRLNMYLNEPRQVRQYVQQLVNQQIQSKQQFLDYIILHNTEIIDNMKK